MNKDFLLIGHPRFIDTELGQIAEREGQHRAWQILFSQPRFDLATCVAGDFAVAVRLPDGSVAMAVDRFAIHSLCYRIAQGELQFAGRADELADSTTAIDVQALFDYFHFHCIPSPTTIFHDISRLPAGHLARLKGGKLDISPYWRPSFQEGASPRFAALKEEFIHLLHQAVGRQLDGSKAACFLSGGTDSSTVAGMIGAVQGQPAATYSIGFEAEGYDEMAFARIAAKRFGTEHHEYYVTPDDLVRGIPAVACHYDQPFGNSSALPAYYCARLAAEDGVSRILGGDGGDELFGGNTRYAKQRVFGWYDHVPGALRQHVLEPVLDHKLMAQLPVVSKAKSYVQQARIPMPDRLQLYNLIHRLGIPEVFSDRFLAAIDLNGPLVHQRAVWASVQGDCSALNRLLAFDWRYTLAESDLPKIVGTTSLAGLDVGFPMLDDDLLAFSERLPTAYKLNGLRLRWFFKAALKGFLPDEIITKKKQGFGLPFGVWAINHAALRTLAEESLRSLVDRRILQSDFVEALFKRHLPAHPGYYGEMVWISMMLEQWLRGHRSTFSL